MLTTNQFLPRTAICLPFLEGDRDSGSLSWNSSRSMRRGGIQIWWRSLGPLLVYTGHPGVQDGGVFWCLNSWSSEKVNPFKSLLYFHREKSDRGMGFGVFQTSASNLFPSVGQTYLRFWLVSGVRRIYSGHHAKEWVVWLSESWEAMHTFDKILVNLGYHQLKV